MKKRVYMAAVVLIAAGGIFWGCQKDEVLNNPDEGLMLKSGEIDCDCVDEPIIENFVTTLSNQGNFANVEVWNDNEKLFIKVTANNANTMDRIQLSYPFEYSVTNAKQCNFDVTYNNDFNNDDVAFTTHTFELELPENWNGCDQVGFALIVKGNGNPVYLQGEDKTKDFEYKQGSDILTQTCTNVPSPVIYTLMEICDVECEESFTYVNNQNGTLTFTYVPAEDLTDVKVVFTFPHVEYITFLEGYEYETFERPGNGNAQNMQTTLSFNACEVYTWKIELVDCTAENPVANGWTNFTVDGNSKKNTETPNFTYECL